MIAASRARLPLLSPVLRGIRHESSSRSGLHRPPRIRRFVPDSLTASAQVSLAEELFPERQNNGGDKEPLSEVVDEKDLPLSLPSLEELLADQKKASRPRIKTEAASKNAVRQENCAVLLLQSASTSLVENDFRLLCPKGKHIEGWTGLGDVEKVIPGRDPVTLERSSYYFLLFRNPAHALAYQANALRLYRHARAHTPSSIFSAPAPYPGTKVPPEFRHAVPVSHPPPLADSDSDAAAPATPDTQPPPPDAREREEDIEDAYTLFQDFALCAPAQRLHLTYIRPPFSPALLRLIAQGGYLGDRTGRAVLLRIAAGPRVRAADLQIAIARAGEETAQVEDVAQVTTAVTGRSRTRNGKGNRKGKGNQESNPEPEPETDSDPGTNTGTGIATEAPRDRFIITLPDDTAAQRFFRAWNQRHVVFSSFGSSTTTASGSQDLEVEEQEEEEEEEEVDGDRVAVLRAEVLW